MRNRISGIEPHLEVAELSSTWAFLGLIDRVDKEAEICIDFVGN